MKLRLAHTLSLTFEECNSDPHEIAKQLKKDVNRHVPSLVESISVQVRDTNREIGCLPYYECWIKVLLVTKPVSSVDVREILDRALILKAMDAVVSSCGYRLAPTSHMTGFDAISSVYYAACIEEQKVSSCGDLRWYGTSGYFGDYSHDILDPNKYSKQ